MHDYDTVHHRRLYERLRGSTGLIVGVGLGAAAFGASTAGAGPSNLDDPARRPSVKEEVVEEELHEEYVLSLEPDFEAPPTATRDLATRP